MEILEDRDAWLAKFEANWLAHYTTTGQTNWKIYNRPKNAVAPSGKGIDLSNSRLVLISSAGAYLKNSQAAYDAPNVFGDYSTRIFPTNTPFSALEYAHDHYDHTAVKNDPQVLLPLRHLEAMVAEGLIGDLAENVVSFSGYQPVVTRVLDETIPAIIRAVKQEEVDAAFLVPA
jgi:hypothetical protein